MAIQAIETAAEPFRRAAVCFKITPSQQLAFDRLRRKQHLTRTGLIEAALATYFDLHDEDWPVTERRRP